MTLIAEEGTINTGSSCSPSAPGISVPPLFCATFLCYQISFKTPADVEKSLHFIWIMTSRTLRIKLVLKTSTYVQAKLMEERLYLHRITQWQYFKFSFLPTWYWKFPKEFDAQAKKFQNMPKIHFMNLLPQWPGFCVWFLCTHAGVCDLHKRSLWNPPRKQCHLWSTNSDFLNPNVIFSDKKINHILRGSRSKTTYSVNPE